MRMNPNVKPALLGAAGGAIALALLGFTWGGWVTGGSAEAMVKKGSDAAVVAALVPLCVLDFRDQPDAPIKLAELQEVASYQQGKFIEDAGWATIPTNAKPNSAVARACATELLKTSS